MSERLEMECKRCGDNEYRIDGFCSNECKDKYSLEEALSKMSIRIAELEEENDRLQDAWFVEDEMRVSEHANYLLNEYGRLQFDYAAYCKPYGESLRNEARNNLETYIAELEHRNKVLEDACEMLRKENGRVTQLLDFWKGLSTNGRKVQE